MKYVLVATTLRLFSAHPHAKRLYRFLGNALHRRLRLKRGLTKSHLDRARLILKLAKEHDAIQDGGRLLELGTGWVHWESLILRLFYDVSITLFDVWDNRLLECLKVELAALERAIDKEIKMDATQHERVHSLLTAISSIQSFDDLYGLLGFEYAIDSSGTLRQFQDATYDAIYSHDVLEHVRREILPEYIVDVGRVLRPGGYSIHTIDLTDHLYYYDSSVSAKNYLRYSDEAWMRWFEHDIQHFNRVQRTEWLHMFGRAGLQLVDQESTFDAVNVIAVDKQWQLMDAQELQCTTLRIVHKKPHAMV